MPGFRLTRLPALVALAGLLMLLAGRASAELVVIVNVRSGVAAMTRGEVINIFFGRYRQFFNGIEAEPVELADGRPERGRFYRALVGKELSDIDAYWSRQVFSGRAKPPVQVKTPEELLKWVASHPGGIGFVELSLVDARFQVVYELKP